MLNWFYIVNCDQKVKALLLLSHIRETTGDIVPTNLYLSASCQCLDAAKEPVLLDSYAMIALEFACLPCCSQTSNLIVSKTVYWVVCAAEDVEIPSKLISYNKLQMSQYNYRTLLICSL